MKKLLSVLLVITLVASGFVGCTGGSMTESAPETTEETAETESAEGEKPVDSSNVTLSIMASQDWVYPAEQELAKKYEEMTGVKVDYQIVPSDQYFNLLLTKLNAGECTDIFGSQSGKFDIVSQLNVEKNAVELTNEPWVERFDDFNAAELSVNGKLYGMTYSDTTTDYYIVYNKKIFAENGIEVPKTYAEFEAACEKLLAAGINPIYEPAADIWHHVMWFAEIGPMYSELTPDIIEKLNNNETTFAENPMFVDAFTQIAALAEKGYWGDNYLSDEFTQLPLAMNSGEYAMTIGRAGSIPEIVAADPSGAAVEDFGLMYIPILDNDYLNLHPCGPSRFIYSGSPHVEEAKAYFDFLASPESLQYMIDNEDRIENYPFEGTTPSYSSETLAFVEGSAKTGVVFQDEIKYLNPQWMDIGQDMVSVFSGLITPEELVKNIDKRRAEQAQANNDPAWAE